MLFSLFLSFLTDWFNYFLYVTGLILRLFSILFLCALVLAEVKTKKQDKVYDYLDSFEFLIPEIEDKLYNEVKAKSLPVSLQDSLILDSCDPRPYYRLNAYDYVFYDRGALVNDGEGGMLHCKPLTLFYCDDYKLIFFYDYLNRRFPENISAAEFALLAHRIIAGQSWFRAQFDVTHYWYPPEGADYGTSPGPRDMHSYIYGPRVRKRCFYTKSLYNLEKFFSFNKPTMFSITFRCKYTKPTIFLNIFEYYEKD